LAVAPTSLAQGRQTSGSTAPTDGFWDATNAPYVVYAPYKATDSAATLTIQRVKADGTDSGGPVSVVLPTDQAQPTQVVASLSGTKLGLLYGAVQTPTTGYPNNTTQLLVTTTTGTAAAPLAVSVSTTNGQVSNYAYHLFLAPSAASQWLMLHFAGTGTASWGGYAGPVTSATTFESLTTSPLDGYASAAILGDTVMATGLSCTNYRTGMCTAPSLYLRRYAVSDLSALSGPTNLLGVTYYNGAAAPPAMAAIGSSMAVLWSDVNASGEISMGTALVNKDGTFKKAPTKTSSTFIPKAIAPTPSGGVLLVATRFDAKAATYTPIVQRLTADLAPDGPSYPIGASATADPMTYVHARNSTDGRTLVTYRLANNPYRRIVHTELCQP
jgi:hypothetical protein